MLPFSLIFPAIDEALALGQEPALVVTLGILIGGLTLYITDRIAPRIHLRRSPHPRIENRERWSIILVIAMIIGNIPESLSIGVLFGALASNSNNINITGALLLAIGLGLQDISDGAAIGVSLKGYGISTKRSFFLSQLCGMVGPVFIPLGALLAYSVGSALPTILGFAGGAMIYIVAEQLIPDAENSKYNHLATLSIVIGFIFIMVLNLTLG